MDTMIPINLKSNSDIQKEIGEKFKKQRLLQNLSRQGLAEKSGVSAESIKKFESTGEISLKSLVALADALEKLGEIEKIMENVEPTNASELKNIKRQRGRV